MQNQAEPQADRQGFPLGPLLFLMGIFFLSFLSRIIISPLLPTIEKDLGITHAASGSFFFFLSLGYFLSMIGSGFISAGIGHRVTIICSSLATGGALLAMTAVETVTGVRVVTFLLGIAGGIYLPSAIAVITALSRQKHWGRAFAIHEVAPNLAFLAAPMSATLLLTVISWQQVFLVPGIFCIVIGILFFLFGSRENPYGEMPLLAQCMPLFQMRSFWLMIVIFAVGIVSTLGIYNLLPLFLVSEHGMRETAANTLVSYSRISTLFTALLGGWLSDRFGPRPTMIGVLSLTGFITISLGLAGSEWIQLLVFLQPVMAVCFFPAGFALLSGLAPLESRNVVISLVIPIAVLLGGGVVPAVIGFMADVELFRQGIAMAGGLMLMGAGLVWLVRS